MTIRKDTSGHPSLSVFSPMMPGARLIEELEIGSFVAPPFPRERPETLRVVSWNINRGLRIISRCLSNYVCYHRSER